MKKVFLILALSILYPPLAFSSAKFIVTKDSVNVRVDSTTSSRALGHLFKNNLVEVVGERYDWYKIILPKKFPCYIAKEYTKTLKDNKIKVTGSKINLRDKPSLKSNVLGQAPKDTVFPRISQTAEWVKIQAYPYTYGWVHKKLLQKVTNVAEQELKELNVFVQEVMPKLSSAEEEKKEEIYEQLIQKGKKVVPILEAYLSKADKDASYSIISILTKVGKNNPELVAYFLKKADSQSLKAASAYLDIAQEIIETKEPKVGYFYLVEQGKLSQEDIDEARTLLNKAYDEKMNPIQEMQKKTIEQ